MATQPVAAADPGAGELPQEAYRAAVAPAAAVAVVVESPFDPGQPRHQGEARGTADQGDSLTYLPVLVCHWSVLHCSPVVAAAFVAAAAVAVA